MNAKKGLALVVIGALAVAAAFLLRRHDPRDVIRIGSVVVDPPGTHGEVGRAVREGLQLAQADLNAEWSGEPSVELTIVDSGGSASGGNEKLNELHKSGIDLVLEVVGREIVTGCAGTLRNNKMLLVSATETGSELGRLLGPNSFRVRAAEGAEGAELARWAREVRVQKPVLVYAPSGATAADSFAQTFGNVGPALQIAVPEDASHAAEVAERVASTAPDALCLFVSAKQAADIVRAVREKKIAAATLGTHALGEAEFAKAGPDVASGALYVVGSAGTTPPRRAAITERWQKQFGSGKTPDPAVFLAYDALQVLARGARAAGSDVERTAARLRTQDYDGTTGRVTFDQNGDRQVEPFARFVLSETGAPTPYSPNSVLQAPIK
jgi:branched-chain amino acid transport system substrate-binding protein